MPPIEIPETCEFDIVGEDKVIIKTQTNGDRIILHADLTQLQAASLAYLANSTEILSIEIKIKD